jgi:hypothetical protein
MGNVKRKKEEKEKGPPFVLADLRSLKQSRSMPPCIRRRLQVKMNCCMTIDGELIRENNDGTCRIIWFELIIVPWLLRRFVDLLHF